MKRWIYIGFLLLQSPLLFGQSHEVPEFAQALGFSAGLSSGTGFTYRYFQDWGWSVSAMGYYSSESFGQAIPSSLYFVGGALLKKLAYTATANRRFSALFYGLWGATLHGASLNEAPYFGTAVTTGPGLGLEISFFGHLSLYVEVLQAGTVYLLSPPHWSSVDAGPVLGGGIVYRY